MRSLKDIERDLEAARAALSHVEGNPAEVYSRIVGYYRSVRNWNKGKREEYGERLLYNAASNINDAPTVAKVVAAAGSCVATPVKAPVQRRRNESVDSHVLLFVRPTCPACPSAKVAAGRLGIPVDLVNADTEAGLAEAAKRHVLSTPTAILLTKDGMELGRARDNASIAAFGKLVS
jgi:ribonucleoside-triphosphate reductase